MNKKMLLLAGAFGALFAGKAAKESPTARMVEDVAEASLPHAVSHEVASRQPGPAKPTSQPVAQRKVTLQAPPLFAPMNPRFIEKPHQRKVKYGKHRWVIV